MKKLLLLGAVCGAALVPASAEAATKNGITPLAPAAGKTIPVGQQPTFRMRVRGQGQVWVHVCKSAKKNREGVICTDESIGRATKRGSVFQYKPRLFDFPGFWLSTPGTYYWQAHRIDCSGNVSDCRRESPVVKFKVG